ncbi:uncharacterized protein CC84DRAFT_496428 [Paraphaeosphaeria sporulosa]|uniref:Uncharacterized protein n=1 Tax=Paraphaeosphaeria sporulosa TaxID=1460663 RepID=A0A177CUG4_9PLEO|nr:uncharacterized protein CC84DRAFT_496428 [Paraphaeosphaeria sporulosa]OAG10841.1 hypothetical protein CC84DRAFT_496428 [Paraphaeosphaeria sporulosa]
MLLLQLITPLLLLTASVAARGPHTRKKTPWGADTLSSLYSRTSTPTTSATSAPPTVVYPAPTTLLDNRKYKRTLAKSRTVESPTTPPPPLPPVRTGAPPTIENGEDEELHVNRPEVEPKVEQHGPSTPQAQSATPTPSIQLETTIMVYRETRSASKTPAPPPESVDRKQASDDWYLEKLKRLSCWLSRNCDPSVQSYSTTSLTPPTENAQPRDFITSFTPLTEAATSNVPRPSEKPKVKPEALRASGKDKPILDRTLCKPCIDIMRRCMVERVQAGGAMDDATYRKCMRQLCFFDERWPARCKAGGRCGDSFDCPKSEVLLRDWDEDGFYR